MASNYGTSRAVKISGQKFTVLKGFRISDVKDAGSWTSPPVVLNNADVLSLTSCVNKYRDFTFSKICRPLYGDDKSVARYTGIPANQPDHIADFHFIGLMRIIDSMLMPKYSGYIAGNWSSPSPSGNNGATPSN